MLYLNKNQNMKLYRQKFRIIKINYYNKTVKFKQFLF